MDSILISIILGLIILIITLYSILCYFVLKLDDTAKKSDLTIKELQKHIKSLYKYNENLENAILELREEIQEFTEPSTQKEFEKGLEEWLTQA